MHVPIWQRTLIRTSGPGGTGARDCARLIYSNNRIGKWWLDTIVMNNPGGFMPRLNPTPAEEIADKIRESVIKH